MVTKKTIETKPKKEKITKTTGSGKKPAKKAKPKRMEVKDLKAFKERITTIKDELLYQIKDLSENTLMKSQKDMSGDISGYTLHVADVATDHYDREFNLNLVANERNVLMQVEDALKRIEDKIYGICQQCEKLIKKSRLKAIPYTRYCKRCQDKFEKENKI